MGLPSKERIMLLMDTVAGAAAIVAGSRLRDPVMMCYQNITDALKGAPRFLFDSKATRTVVELNLGRPKIIVEAMQNLRVPYTRMWVEWDDADRQKLRDRFIFGEGQYDELRPMPGRVGFLLEADESGRRGTVTWAWTTPRGPGLPEDGTAEKFPNVGAIETFFDLDHAFPMHPDRLEGLLAGNLAQVWKDNPVQLQALIDIWKHTEFHPSSWGERFLKMHPNPELMLALAYSDVVGEWIMAVCILLLLTASRPVVEHKAVDQSKINKHRRKKGEVPLYDHTVVSLHLSTPPAAAAAAKGPLGHARKPPRIHLVSSYLARRGDKHWITPSYIRGSGEPVSRHVHVKG
jgi:hypothetical protein